MYTSSARITILGITDFYLLSRTTFHDPLYKVIDFDQNPENRKVINMPLRPIKDLTLRQ